VLSILIAGYQDKKTRIAPAIYLSPTLIGFGLNPMLGLIGLIFTMLGLFLWKDSWNEVFGLADALFFLCILFCCLNPNTLFFVFPISVAVVLELVLRKSKDKVPLVWVYAKWILITLVLFVILMLLKGWLL
jgi:hypothetical protein